ncbi:MAG: hypothetical protein L6Q84_26365 [Polyangiaceae bacterium]|nr:hypothetical protein [Polyangiaceae bacterium]
MWRAARLGLVALGLCSACLPAETRPPPGELTLTATADPAVLAPIATADGWSVSFDRILMSIGFLTLGKSDDCDSYAGANYGRLLDFGRSEPQRVGAVYAIGRCDVGFALAEPPPNTVLGAGVSAADLSFMREKGSDKYASDRAISFFVAGTAARSGKTKTFHFALRRALVYEECRAPDGQAPTVALGSDESVAFDLRVRAQALLQDDLDDQVAKLAFDPFARADDEAGDRDGEVTLDELGKLPLGELGKASGAWATDTSKWKSFRDYLYLGLAPTVLRFEGTGRCAHRSGAPKSGMGGPMH